MKFVSQAWMNEKNSNLHIYINKQNSERQKILIFPSRRRDISKMWKENFVSYSYTKKTTNIHKKDRRKPRDFPPIKKLNFPNKKTRKKNEGAKKKIKNWKY